jgi:hypothetical protein
MAQPNYPSAAPYAQRDRTAAESEGGKEQVGDPNTKRSTKGAAISPGTTDNSGRDTPQTPTPYANESRNCATNESGKGL